VNGEGYSALQLLRCGATSVLCRSRVVRATITDRSEGSVALPLFPDKAVVHAESMKRMDNIERGFLLATSLSFLALVASIAALAMI
jgi:hypothetical protein